MHSWYVRTVAKYLPCERSVPMNKSKENRKEQSLNKLDTSKASPIDAGMSNLTYVWNIEYTMTKYDE